jgi:drug/metabolite transporter (DMT)-like permease
VTYFHLKSCGTRARRATLYQASVVHAGACHESYGMRAKMMQYWWLILLSILCGVAGQTVIKIGVSQPGASEAADGILSLVAMIFRSPLVLGGLVLYGVGALAWIAVLARVDLSVAYPFLALNFVLVTFSSQFFLGESVPMLRWLGVLIICSGIYLVARSSV